MKQSRLDRIADDMLAVLRLYDIATASKEHCLKNLRQWESNKKCLMGLLSKHPHWSEDNLAVVLQQGRQRKLDVDGAFEQLFSFHSALDAEAIAKGDKPARSIDQAWIDCIYHAKSPLLTEEQVELLRKIDAQASVGQKISRAFNAWCKKVGYDKDKNFNKNFAKFADFLNPIEITETMFLSVHPMDFLLMSLGNSWKTCQSLDGCYSGGTVSYMNDGTTMVSYTVKNGDGALPQSKREKTMRQLFHYNGGTLVQGRLYPKTYHCKSEPEYVMFRNAIQAIVAQCEGMPNLWHTIHDEDTLEEYAVTNPQSSQYADYANNKNECCLSRLGTEFHRVEIGSVNYCVVCGEHCYSTNDIACCNEHKCHRCGNRFSRDEMTRLEDGFLYCMRCTSVCWQCDETCLVSDMIPVHTTSDEDSDTASVCSCCAEDYFMCWECGLHYPRFDAMYVQDKSRLLPELQDKNNNRICLACFLGHGNTLTDEQRAAYQREDVFAECV